MLLEEALAASDKADGWLTRKEQTLLYNLAKEVPAGKAIVELGSWMGKATIMLAAGSMAGSKVPVYAVDYFTITKKVSHDYSPYLNNRSGDYFPTFLENIRNAGLSSIVTPIKSSTVKAGEMWVGPAPHLLFIDADHSYRSVHDDFLAWISHCGLGARVAFHDFDRFKHPGVFLFVSGLSASVISHVGSVDCLCLGELTTTDTASIKRRLRHFPHLLASFLSLAKKAVRKVFRLACRKMRSEFGRCPPSDRDFFVNGGGDSDGHLSTPAVMKLQVNKDA